MSKPQVASATGGLSQVAAVPRKTISQEKTPTKHGNGLIFRVYSPKLWQNIRLRTGKGLSKPKNKTIGNKAHRYRLERISRDLVCVARLWGLPVLPVFSRRHLIFALPVV